MRHFANTLRVSANRCCGLVKVLVVSGQETARDETHGIRDLPQIAAGPERFDILVNAAELARGNGGVRESHRDESRCCRLKSAPLS
jgi:hypothetical protein